MTWHMTNIIAFLLIVTLAETSHAQSVCSDSELSACSTNLKSPVCLELYHACGRYEDIIENFRVDQLKEPTSKFYAGMSFYGLFNRTRVKSIQCEYAEESKNLLSEFVFEIKQTKGFRNQAEFRQVYRASKTLMDLKTTIGCLEKGLSPLDVQSQAQSYSEGLMKKLFIRKGGSGSGLDSVIGELKSNIQTTVRGITSKAAEIEAQLTMRRLALEASKRTMGKLIQLYNDFFGSAEVSSNSREYPESIQLNLRSTSQFGSAETLATDFLSRAKKVDSAVSTALGAVSAEQYQLAKISLITRAQDESNLAGATYNQGLGLISAESPGNALVSLVSNLKSAVETDRSLDIHKKLKAEWTPVLGFNCVADSRNWICQDPNGANP